MAGPADDQFISLLQNLGKQVQGYGLSQAINTANEQVATLKNGMQDEYQKRRALSDLADRTALNLQAGGADPAQVQLAKQSIMPPVATSYQQALLSGDPFLIKAATEAQDGEETRNMRKLQEQQAFQFKLTERLEQGRDARAELAAGRAASRAAHTPNAQNLKAAGYASQLIQSNNNYEKLAAKGVTGAEFYRPLTNLLPRGLQSDSYQQVMQAQDEFINAVARPESGAAISETERARYRTTYFGVGGEGPSTLKQLAEARQSAIQKTIVESGPASEMVSTVAGGTAALGRNITNFNDPQLNSVAKPLNSYLKPKARR